MLPSIVYFYILLCFMTWIKPGQSFSCSCDENLNSDFTDAIKLRLYKCDGTFANTSYPITAPENMVKALDKTKRTIFYIFGFTQSADHNDTKSIISVLCDLRKDNVVVLDWSEYSQAKSPIDYVTKVFPNAQKTGCAFAKSLGKLVTIGLQSSQIYVIGFSVGAHIASFAGRFNDFEIPRITGLDPANPLTTGLYGCYLSSENAQWVDVIHSDMGGYGTLNIPPVTATAHFYANRGHRPQPNCPLIGLPLLSPADFCSHTAAIRAYVESVRNRTKYIATPCKVYPLLCGGEKQTIGYYANNVKGKFYFKTV